MTQRDAALAVFVKTPGLSPIKTRLAAGIGAERASEFFDLSLAAVEATAAVVAESGGVQPYWAVAEEGGLTNARWQRFPRVHQGTGNLGDRLGWIFTQLQRRHEIVLAMGADSPQITPSTIQAALGHLRQDSSYATHVLARCHDGGFYLIGTNRSMAPETWQEVPYSTSAAADRLAAKLGALGTVVELRALSDVDRAADLAVLVDELRAIANRSPEQMAVLNWTAALQRRTTQ